MIHVDAFVSVSEYFSFQITYGKKLLQEKNFVTLIFADPIFFKFARNSKKQTL